MGTRGGRGGPHAQRAFWEEALRREGRACSALKEKTAHSKRAITREGMQGGMVAKIHRREVGACGMNSRGPTSWGRGPRAQGGRAPRSEAWRAGPSPRHRGRMQAMEVRRRRGPHWPAVRSWAGRSEAPSPLVVGHHKSGGGAKQKAVGASAALGGRGRRRIGVSRGQLLHNARPKRGGRASRRAAARKARGLVRGPAGSAREERAKRPGGAVKGGVEGDAQHRTLP